MTTLHVHFNDRVSFTKAVQHVAYEWPPRHFAHDDLSCGAAAGNWNETCSWGHAERATHEAIALYQGEVTS